MRSKGESAAVSVAYNHGCTCTNANAASANASAAAPTCTFSARQRPPAKWANNASPISCRYKNSR
ncbi:MAG: hypothetical protein CK538_04245 [Opitutia bacterium]|nr:MAG: hypothetical protein CK538_04245 [Opitutae bacterium]